LAKPAVELPDVVDRHEFNRLRITSGTTKSTAIDISTDPPLGSSNCLVCRIIAMEEGGSKEDEKPASQPGKVNSL
jgi:hypothetical protein